MSSTPVPSADSISVMRAHLRRRLEALDNNRKWRGDAIEDEDVRFQNFEDQQHLEWMEDDELRYSEEERVYVYLSSVARDRVRWPNPGQYMITLDSEIDNVIKADLVQFSFPLTDATVNSTNQIIRYSFAPHNVVNEVIIPEGSYTGGELAVEIMKQMNMSFHNADILAGTYFIDEETGYIVDGSGNPPPDPYPQFRVRFERARHKFYFTLVDEAKYPLSTPVWALHIQPQPTTGQIAFRNLTDDLWDVLGFSRTKAEQVGTYDAGSDTYYLISTTDYFDFGPADDVDKRIAFGLHSSRVAEMRGGQVIVLDIDPLNDNDIGHVQDAPSQGFDVGSCFGMVLARDAAQVADRMLDVSNGNYPVQKYYRDGRSRVKQIHVTLRRLDGSIFDFGGADHFMTLRLVSKRTQPRKSVFTRG